MVDGKNVKLKTDIIMKFQIYCDAEFNPCMDDSQSMSWMDSIFDSADDCQLLDALDFED